MKPSERPTQNRSNPGRLNCKRFRKCCNCVPSSWHFANENPLKRDKFSFVEMYTTWVRQLRGDSFPYWAMRRPPHQCPAIKAVACNWANGPAVLTIRWWHECGLIDCGFGCAAKDLFALPTTLGTTGQNPTHPELLDYLAGRLIQNQWSTKALVRGDLFVGCLSTKQS
jgi:hypothetical protein